jgi:hypothetical protein
MRALYRLFGFRAGVFLAAAIIIGGIPYQNKIVLVPLKYEGKSRFGICYQIRLCNERTP